MTRSIDSGSLSLNNKAIVVEIPRKEAEFYKSFEKILNITKEENPDIFYIKETNKEPSTYKQAIQSQEGLKQDTAMREELEELEKQNTQEITNLPKSYTTLGGRQVYKIKNNNITNTIKYKARQVIQGFNQVEYLDYIETFSTVCRPETYRTAFIITISKGWKILQYDVKNAFVHAVIDTDIYIKLLTGYYNNITNNKVFKLKKALYGLK